MTEAHPWRSVADDPPPLDTPVVVRLADGTIIQGSVLTYWPICMKPYWHHLDRFTQLTMHNDPPVWWLDPAGLPAPPEEENT